VGLEVTMDESRPLLISTIAKGAASTDTIGRVAANFMPPVNEAIKYLYKSYITIYNKSVYLRGQKTVVPNGIISRCINIMSLCLRVACTNIGYA